MQVPTRCVCNHMDYEQHAKRLVFFPFSTGYTTSYLEKNILRDGKLGSARTTEALERPVANLPGSFGCKDSIAPPTCRNTRRKPVEAAKPGALRLVHSMPEPAARKLPEAMYRTVTHTLVAERFAGLRRHR
jgi:hypothetical protein